jgi:hypothetical protein
LPFPLLPDVTVIHESLLNEVHEHAESEVVILTVPVSEAEVWLALVGLME